MELSIRMKAVADMVTPGKTMADIGTDHAYVPVYLVQKGICPSAIAMDVRKGPLEHANASIRKYCLTDKIATRLSDGLKELKAGEVRSVVIAGMGGLLMIRLLDDSKRVVDQLDECILQPQSDLKEVRQYVHGIGFKILHENMVIDNDKFYTMMKIVKGQDEAYNDEDEAYGKLLIDEGHPVLEAFLNKELKTMDHIMDNLKKQTSEKSRNRLLQLETERRHLMRALERLKANKEVASC